MSEQLTSKFKPIVARETAKLKIAPLYDKYAGMAASYGLVSAQDAILNDYVTAKALDGLFSRIADEEKAIRCGSVGEDQLDSEKVFGQRPSFGSRQHPHPAPRHGLGRVTSPWPHPRRRPLPLPLRNLE